MGPLTHGVTGPVAGLQYKRPFAARQQMTGRSKPDWTGANYRDGSTRNCPDL
jgi:hypothetical protein